MITDAKFEKGITLLQKHFNRTLEEMVIAIWREHLDEHLDDEEFTTAVKEAILTCEFFPTPKKLVELASGSLEVAAIQQWQVIVSAATTTSDSWTKELLASLQERSRMALQVIGSLQAVAMADEWLLKKLEKQFTTVYCQPSSKIKLLPPAKVQPRNYEPVDNQTAYKPSDPSTKPEPLRRMFEALELRVSGIQRSSEEAASDTFFLRYRWKIDENRIKHYLGLDLESKRGLVLMMDTAFRNKSLWQSGAITFDRITDYKAPEPEIDARAIARQWLEEA